MKSWNKRQYEQPYKQHHLLGLKQRNARKPDLFSTITITIALLVILLIGSAICAVITSGLPCFAETVRSAEVLFAFRLSVCTASISTVIVMLLALPTAYALTRTDMPFKGFSGLLIELTLSLPYLLLGLSLLIIFSSPAGKWMKLHGFKVVFSPAGIVMAHILVNLPYAIRLIRTCLLYTSCFCRGGFPPGLQWLLLSWDRCACF